MKNQLILIALIPIYAITYLLIARSYPYYAFWDSSMFFTLDAMITRSGQLADHFFHPNIVPLVINGYFVLPLGKLLGLISIDSILELKKVQNPFLPFAEVANLLLLTSILLSYIFITLMYICITKIINPIFNCLNSKQIFVFHILIMLLALTWGALPNILVWIRYESYAVIFWLTAFFILVVSSESSNPYSKIFIAGVFAGASFFSKIQFIGAALCLPLLYFMLENNRLNIEKKKFTRITIPIFSLIFLTCSLIHYLSYRAIEQGKIIGVAFLSSVTSNDFQPITPLILFLILALSCLISYFFNRVPKIFIRFVFISTFFYAGSFIVLFASLFLGTSWVEKKSSLEIAYIFSFMFGQLNEQGKNIQYLNLYSNLSTNILIFIFLLLLIIILGFNQIKKLTNLSNQQFLFGSFFILALTFSNIIFIRQTEFQKDFLFNSVLLLISIIIIVRMYFLAFLNYKKLLFFFSTLVFSFWLLFQFVTLSNYHKLIFDNGNYSYQIYKWRDFSYGYRGNQYLDLMDYAYPNNFAWKTSFNWSKNIYETKLLLWQVFRDASVGLNDTSVGAIGGLLSPDSDSRIYKLSSSLDASLIVPWSNKVLKIFPRADYTIYVAYPKELSQLENQLKVTNFDFFAKNNNKIIKFQVYELTNVPATIDVVEGHLYVIIKPK